MATPIVEQIAAAIATQLGTICPAEGYQTTPTAVVRPTRVNHLITPQEGNLILTQDDAEVLELLNGNPPTLVWRQGWNVDIVWRPSDAATEPADTTFNLWAADVEKAVMAVPQWGGLAVNTELIGRTFAPPNADGIDGITVTFAVTYRVDEDDPYTKA